MLGQCGCSDLHRRGSDSLHGLVRAKWERQGDELGIEEWCGLGWDMYPRESLVAGLLDTSGVGPWDAVHWGTWVVDCRDTLGAGRLSTGVAEYLE